MNDELIDRLRERDISPSPIQYVPDDLCHEAADAIESLEAKIAELREFLLIGPSTSEAELFLEKLDARWGKEGVKE